MKNKPKRLVVAKPSPLFNKSLQIFNNNEFSALISNHGRILSSVWLGSLNAIEEDKSTLHYAELWTLDAVVKVESDDSDKPTWRNTIFGFYVWYEYEGRLWRCQDIDEVAEVLKDIKIDFKREQREHNADISRFLRQKKNQKEGEIKNQID